jgi:hypothetical protein
MTKARLHPTLLELRGAMGDMVFRNRNGKVFVSIKSNGSNSEPTAAQTAHRERFRQAVAYSKFAMADNATREVYEYAAQQQGKPAFSLGVADFLNAPSIDEVDASGYKGQAGGSINIITSDDFGVVNVNVLLADADLGTLIESGQAIEYPVGTGHWSYTATTQAPAGITVSIEVKATDRPGGTAVQRGTKNI